MATPGSSLPHASEPLRHCTVCGAPLASVPRRAHARCARCGTVDWRNPVPVALVLIEHEQGLVLIRRRLAPLADHWAPPSGYVERGESVSEAALREAQEETGLRITLDGLHGVYSDAGVDVLIVAYRAHVVGGVARAADDAAEIGIFAPGALPAAGPAPTGPALDRWFHGVIGELTAPWRMPRTTPETAT